MDLFTQSDMFSTPPNQKIKKRKKRNKKSALLKTIDKIEKITTAIKDVDENEPYEKG